MMENRIIVLNIILSNMCYYRWLNWNRNPAALFSNVGTHCSHPECKMQGEFIFAGTQGYREYSPTHYANHIFIPDFLPFQCDACTKIFCLAHRSYKVCLIARLPHYFNKILSHVVRKPQMIQFMPRECRHTHVQKQALVTTEYFYAQSAINQVTRFVAGKLCYIVQHLISFLHLLGCYWLLTQLRTCMARTSIWR